jgi:uncharacterized membrane protein YcaP (DUF421 family)
MHALTSLLGIRIPRLGELLGGRKRLIIDEGRLLKRAMVREMISEEEVLMLLRNQSIEDPATVRRAYLEPDGSLSVFKYHWPTGPSTAVGD